MTTTKRLEKEARRMKEMRVLEVFEKLTKTELVDLFNTLIAENAVTVKTTKTTIKVQCHNDTKTWLKEKQYCKVDKILNIVEKNCLTWHNTSNKVSEGTDVYKMKDCTIMVTYDR